MSEEWDKRLEDFWLAAWGKNSFIRFTHAPGSSIRTIQYLDFGNHLQTMWCICRGIRPKVIVFKEYGAAIDRFEEDDKVYSNGACIVGQPGIGKTSFVAYAVVARLRDEKPVAVQISRVENLEEYLLFTSNGVTIHESGDAKLLEENGPIWVFSDSNNSVLEPCLAFQSSISANVRIFQTASPAERRWKEWTKRCNVNRYIMDIPSLEEIEDLAVILGKNVKHMKGLAEKWGPVPWTLLHCLEPMLESNLAWKVTPAVNRAIENPTVLFEAIVNHNSSTVRESSTLFFIKPQSKTDRLLPSIYIPTRWLAHQLANGLFRCHEHERVRFLNIMSVHPQACVALSQILEAAANHFLEGEQPDLHRLFCRLSLDEDEMLQT